MANLGVSETINIWKYVGNYNQYYSEFPKNNRYWDRKTADIYLSMDLFCKKYDWY